MKQSDIDQQVATAEAIAGDCERLIDRAQRMAAGEVQIGDPLSSVPTAEDDGTATETLLPWLAWLMPDELLMAAGAIAVDLGLVHANTTYSVGKIGKSRRAPIVDANKAVALVASTLIKPAAVVRPDNVLMLLNRTAALRAQIASVADETAALMEEEMTP